MSLLLPTHAIPHQAATMELWIIKHSNTIRTIGPNTYQAAIAQLGERQTEDLKVPSSILGLGIVNHHHNLLGLVRAPHGHSTCARAMRHMHVGLSWNAARPWRLAMAFSTRAGMPLGPHDTTSSAHQPCAHHAHRYASQAAALRHNGSTKKFSLQPLRQQPR